MLSKQDINKIIHKDLIELLENNLIYKYVGFTTGIENILIANSLKFSNPSTFNDPFDCNEHLLKIKLEKKEIKQYVNDKLRGLDRSKKREIIRKFENPNNITNTIQNQKKDFLISCFSKSFNDVLMWSHYAEKHTGICIGFNFPHLYENHFILGNVKYLSEIKSLDGETDYLKTIMYWLTTKSIKWEYEKEVRAITRIDKTKGKEIINFDKQ